MDQKIRDKLIKCLELTASDADGEALNAIRMANKQRAKLGLSWEQVLNGSGGSSSRGYGTGSHDYYNTDPFTEGMRRAAERDRQEKERQAYYAKQERDRAARKQQWEKTKKAQQEFEEQQRRNSRNSRASASDDFGTGYKKPNEKTFNNWDDVWGV